MEACSAQRKLHSSWREEKEVLTRLRNGWVAIENGLQKKKQTAAAEHSVQ